MTNQDMATRLADAAAGASIATATAISLADIDHVVSICAGIAAIIAALAAAYYHIKKAREKG